MEIFNNIWNIALPWIGGISVGGVATFFITAYLKKLTSKVLNKVDDNKIADKAYNKVVSEVKTVSFSHDIAPLVKSELAEIREENNFKIKSFINQQIEMQVKTAIALEKLGSFFDNSVSVTSAQRADFKAAIAEIKKDIVPKPAVTRLVVAEKQKEKQNIKIDIER